MRHLCPIFKKLFRKSTCCLHFLTAHSLRSVCDLAPIPPLSSWSLRKDPGGLLLGLRSSSPASLCPQLVQHLTGSLSSPGFCGRSLVFFSCIHLWEVWPWFSYPPMLPPSCVIHFRASAGTSTETIITSDLSHQHRPWAPLPCGASWMPHPPS